MRRAEPQPAASPSAPAHAPAPDATTALVDAMKRDVLISDATKTYLGAFPKPVAPAARRSYGCTLEPADITLLPNVNRAWDALVENAD